MKTAIVSEYTRRVAHELDDRHHEWVMYNRVEKIEQASELETSAFVERPNHEAWLTDYENMDAHIAKVQERTLQLQAHLSQFKTHLQRKEYASRHGVPMWQLQAYIARVKSELAYVLILRTRLKEVRRVSNAYLYKQRIAELGGGESLLYQLWMAAKEALQYNSVEPIRKAMDDDGLGNAIRYHLTIDKANDILNTSHERTKLDAHVRERLTELARTVTSG